MKGRKVSYETTMMVRELRRRGLSLRKIAQRAKLSKTSVYRLTKGISWEQHSVRSECIETDRIVGREMARQAARPIPAPEPRFPRVTIGPVDEEKYELDRAEAYLRRNRNLSLLYDVIDLENRLDSLQSDDPLEEYKRLRRKCLSKVAVLNGFWSRRQSC